MKYIELYKILLQKNELNILAQEVQPGQTSLPGFPLMIIHTSINNNKFRPLLHYLKP